MENEKGNMDEVNDLQASPQQKRMFFALCNQLGWDVEMAKDRVKKKYKLESFANIRKDQLTEVIDLITQRTNKKNIETLTEFFRMHLSFKEEDEALTAFDKEKLSEEYRKENFPGFLAKELIKYFDIREKKL